MDENDRLALPFIEESDLNTVVIKAWHPRSLAGSIGPRQFCKAETPTPEIARLIRRMHSSSQ
jgi:hypothetical protein